MNDVWILFCCLCILFLPYGPAKTIVSVLSGRQKYLQILHCYLDKLIQWKYIDDIHLWDFTTSKIDKAYILQLVDAKEGYTYMPAERNHTFDLSNPIFWNDYYKYYSSSDNLQDDDILIKCDDDIVFIDIQNFMQYIHVIKGSQSFVYPNVINNEIGALIQSKYHTHDLINHQDSMKLSFIIQKAGEKELSFNETSHSNYITNWHRNSTMAILSHTLFLNNPNQFIINTTDCLLWKHHIPIHFFGGMGLIVKRFYLMFLVHGQGFTPQTFFTGIGRRHMNGKANKIVPSFLVSHFGFQYQMLTNVEKSLLLRYESLAKTLSSFDVSN